ncbi:hypothetical protein QL093DRAFT_1999817, partial [Fusarium oxysporum]
LKDPCVLPRKVPKSSTIVYNCESRWQANAPRSKLQLCGDDFVCTLHAFCEGLQGRPAAFVGRSLGGLSRNVLASSSLTMPSLLRTALLFADRDDDFGYLPKCTSAFRALRSPFRGTKMYRVANFVVSLTFLAGSHCGGLKALRYDNQLLRDKLQEFCRLWESTSISTCWFFE